MATAKKLPSGNWRVRVCIGKDENGKYRYKSFTDKDKRRCEHMATEYADQMREVLTSDTIGNSIEQYIQERTPVLSPATIKGYREIQRILTTNYKSFCDKQITDIRQKTLQDLINKMSATVSPVTATNRYKLISIVMRYKGYNVPIVKLPELKKPNYKIPDIDDVKNMLKAAEGTELEIPIMLAALAPMRRGEILGLRMEDIDGNTIHVCRSVVLNHEYKIVEKSPKTYESDRYIVMPDFVINKIKEKGYITKYKDPDYLSRRFNLLMKKCGLEGVRFHDLRHFGASWLHAQGIPEQYILERGGWESDRVMKNIYMHTLSSEKEKTNKEIMNKMAQHFG